MQFESNSIKVIDSHTAGEPTRTVIAGGPDLGSGTLNQRLEALKSQDQFRRTVILEPRGYEAMVGTLLCPPDDPDCETGILFFNNEGYLNMCGHGTIGVACTLAYLNRLVPGPCKFQTPAGIIQVELHEPNRASFTNVRSYVLHKELKVNVEQFGELTGEITYSGNWFFNLHPPMELIRENLDAFLRLAGDIRSALAAIEIDGVDSSRVDHIQFFEPDFENGCSKNFVVCPGGEFDRSPCGTGTSSILAGLAERGELAEGDTWTQTSLTGGQFTGTFEWADNMPGPIIPTITGSAFVCAESTLIQNEEDPYRFGNVIKVHHS